MVTGGTGFIGSRIVRDLVKEGAQVVVFDLFPKDTFLGQLLTQEERTAVKIVQGDLADVFNLIHTAETNNVEKIIHMGYLTTAAARANPPLAIKVNCEGTVNVFETARILRLKKVVWASSIAVFGPPEKYSEEYIPNDAPHYAFGLYGACKSLNETTATYYTSQYGVDTLGLRFAVGYAPAKPSGVTGPLIHELMENPAVGKPGRVPNGDDVWNWLYVDDQARAAVLAARVPKTKTRVFNIGGDVRSIKEVADYVKKLIPGADITLLPGRIGVSCKFDTTVTETELGFRPQWSMEQGVREVINTVRRQLGLSPV